MSQPATDFDAPSIIAEIRALREHFDANMIGRTENGVFYPGLAAQFADLLRRVISLEERRVWWRDQGIPIAISLLALACSAWLVSHR